MEASNDPRFGSYEVIGTQGASSFPHMGTWTASWQRSTAYRYVRVRKTASEYLFIAEVRVWGRP